MSTSQARTALFLAENDEDVIVLTRTLYLQLGWNIIAPRPLAAAFEQSGVSVFGGERTMILEEHEGGLVAIKTSLSLALTADDTPANRRILAHTSVPLIDLVCVILRSTERATDAGETPEVVSATTDWIGLSTIILGCVGRRMVVTNVDQFSDAASLARSLEEARPINVSRLKSIWIGEAYGAIERYSSILARYHGQFANHPEPEAVQS